ncbi:hypothetical protein Tco_0892604 [Tanacetum coccineum]|uniref:Uncharacterized protein n=1 Tax=Tanacetum coccineum TaxID=301880 RepID=A0ABQ5C951_9ASTR
MEYLPETFWSQRDKANARAMIHAIDKSLKTRRIMRSFGEIVVEDDHTGVTYGFYKGPYDLSYDVLILKSYKAISVDGDYCRFSDPHDPTLQNRFNTTAETCQEYSSQIESIQISRSILTGLSEVTPYQTCWAMTKPYSSPALLQLFYAGYVKCGEDPDSAGSQEP